MVLGRFATSGVFLVSPALVLVGLVPCVSFGFSPLTRWLIVSLGLLLLSSDIAGVLRFCIRVVLANCRRHLGV